MTTVLASGRRYLATRPRRFWLYLGAGALVLGTVPAVLPMSAFANDVPQLVTRSANTDKSAVEVTARCPGGRTAVSVGARLGGSSTNTTVTAAVPQGRDGTARAVR